MALLAGLAGASMLAACGGSSSGPGGTGSTILVALNIPSTADPYVAGVITRGAQLAVDQANASGGVRVGSATYTLALKKYDDNAQPQQAASNVDSAVHDGAVAVIEDGIGFEASGGKSEAAGVPEVDITNGDTGLLGGEGQAPRASLFRLGIPNDAAAGLLSTYVQSHTQTVALLHDDSGNGRDGSDQMVSNFKTNGVTLSPSNAIEVPAQSPTIDAQVAAVKAANPGGIVLWGGDVFIAKAVTAFRSAGITTP
ncbi:MAG: ABC transporter substrate-binding protein, partial [Candidatus Dormibacteria bacterium]